MTKKRRVEKSEAVDKSPENVDKSARKSKAALPDGRVAPGRGPKKGAPNAGRPPSNFRALMKEIADRHQLAQRLGAMAAGEAVVQSSSDLVAVLAPAKLAEQIAAAKVVLSYAEGMPTQPVEVTDMGVERKKVILPAIANVWPPPAASP